MKLTRNDELIIRWSLGNAIPVIFIRQNVTNGILVNKINKKRRNEGTN